MCEKRTILFLFAFVAIDANLNVGLKFLEKIYDECESSQHLLKCFKIQALKITNKALKFDKIKLVDGVSIVRAENRTAKISFWYPIWQRVNFDRFNSSQIDTLLKQSLDVFVSSRKLDLEVPQLVEEARKKNKKIYFAPLIAAIAIKSGFMALAYKGIAVTAGVAVLAGKMALLLCAIMGLKKLINDREDKPTTIEIVKHPSNSVTHTYSTSHEDDHSRSIASGKDLTMAEKMIHTYEPYDPNP